MGHRIQEEDFLWFLENYDQIYKMYGEVYVAIKNRKILGTYKSFAEGVLTTQESEPLGTFIVQHCNGDESGYTGYIASTNFMYE